MFRVFTTKEFDNDFNHLDESDKKRVSKIMNQLKEQGGDVGKPLGRDYFREKKFG
jgi:mRNA-degrading endonuclease RelE of RelBE toxin-antitoxin system